MEEVVSVESRLRKLELAEGVDDTCPVCGRCGRSITMVVVAIHPQFAQPDPPTGWRPHREPTRCPRCGRPDEVIREVYQDAAGGLWEGPDRVQPQEE
jgi:hypothetical protein